MARPYRCPCGECGTRIARTKLMCPAHWRLVPLALKAKVNAAWHAYQVAVRAEGSATDALPLVKALRAAQREAIEAVAAAEWRSS